MTAPAPPVLEVRSLHVAYGGIVAVDDVDLDVRRGELVGLIGPNGAGKTTTIDAVCGFVPHRGVVRFAGHDLTGMAPHERARAGLARTWQSLELFEDLTVRQNCEVAARRTGLGGLFADIVRPARRSGHDAAVNHALELLGLAPLAEASPLALSHGQQKLVGVARALAAEPALLLLDEPAAGLDTGESLALGRKLREVIGGASLAGLLIDHDTALVFDVCDRVYVLDFGRIIAAGSPDEVRRLPAVQEAYLGIGGPS